MAGVQRAAKEGGGGVHTRALAHARPNTQYAIQYKQTGGLMDPHKATFTVAEVTPPHPRTHPTHTHIRNIQCKLRPEQVIVKFLSLTHTYSHTHTLEAPCRLSVSHTVAQEPPCVHRGGHDNCAGGCTVTSDPWQHGKVGTLSCPGPIPLPSTILPPCNSP